MRKRQSLFATIVMVLGIVPGVSATLAVNATATPDGSLFDYSYQFSITGAGASVDNIFLGSNDLSPLNVVLKVNGNPTANWSWLGNDTPQNYLQFFNITGPALGNGDALDVTFSSTFAPANKGFAEGLTSSTSSVTNTVSGVLAPSAVATTPEPGSLGLFLAGIALMSIAWRHASWVRP
jgi:hypothetical protein